MPSESYNTVAGCAQCSGQPASDESCGAGNEDDHENWNPRPACEVELIMFSKVPYRSRIRRLTQWRKPPRSFVRRVASDAVVSGTAASLASATMLMACSKLHEGSAAGGLNGPSQWLWGEAEAYSREATLRHTATGYAIHHATSIF